MDRRRSSNGTAPALQVQSLKFKPQFSPTPQNKQKARNQNDTQQVNVGYYS
jgi:hypothetical protein